MIKTKRLMVAVDEVHRFALSDGQHRHSINDVRTVDETCGYISNHLGCSERLLLINHAVKVIRDLLLSK